MTGAGGDQAGGLRLAELLAVLSLATDLGIGRAPGNELLVTAVAMRFGRSLSLDDEALREVLAVALLRWIGCTSHAHELAELFDDEIAAQERSAFLDLTSPREMMGEAVRYRGEGSPAAPPARSRRARSRDGPADSRKFLSRQLRGRSAARRNHRAGGNVGHALGAVFERWDGKGWPNGMAGDAIPVSVRIVNVAQDAVNFSSDARRGGCRRRCSANVQGRLMTRLCPPLSAPKRARFLQGGEEETSWERVLEWEPSPVRTVPADEVDDALRASPTSPT